MGKANIGKDASGRIVVSFTYDPLLISKIKTIEGRRWHPVEKHWMEHFFESAPWSFPDTDGMLEKILKIFWDKEVQIDPALKTSGTVPDFVVSPQSNDLRTDNHFTPP